MSMAAMNRTRTRGLIPIRIDAAQAFGTGHHETTTGCLEAIDRVLKRQRPMRPLDLGTGTGILAIAIAKRRKIPVVASDIDPIAVETTRENARVNGVVTSDLRRSTPPGSTIAPSRAMRLTI